MDALQFNLFGKSGRDGIEQAIQVLLDAPTFSTIIIHTECDYLVKSLPFYRSAVANGFPLHGGSPTGFPDSDLWEELEECCRWHQDVSFLVVQPPKAIPIKIDTDSPEILFLDWQEAKEKLPSVLNNRCVRLYCDGSYKPGFVGWGAVFVGKKENSIRIGGNLLYNASSFGFGSEYSELLSIVCSLEFLPEPLTVTVYSDCLSLLNRISNEKFKVHGIHSFIWERLQNVCQRHKISWKWIKGHNGHKYNELADRISRQQRRILEKSASITI